MASKADRCLKYSLRTRWGLSLDPFSWGRRSGVQPHPLIDVSHSSQALVTIFLDIF